VPETGDKIDQDYREVFSGEAGERVLRDLMVNYWIYKGLLEPDPHKTAFNEGQRAVVVDILERIRRKWTPQEFADELTQAQLDYASTRPSTPSATSSCCG
jgi:hypothetical protein